MHLYFLKHKSALFKAVVQYLVGAKSIPDLMLIYFPQDPENS